MNAFKQKYPIFNGKNFVEVKDTTLISSVNGNTTGRIYTKFRTNSNEQQTIYSFRPQNQTGLNQIQLRLNFEYLTDQFALDFVYRENINLLSMHINPTALPIYSLSDGEMHEVEVIIDGIENRIIVDSTAYTVSNGGLIIDDGSETSTYFANSIESIAVGMNDRYNNSVIERIIPFEGYIYEFTIFNTDLTTQLYNIIIDGEYIQDSHFSIVQDLSLVKLPLNGNIVNTSDSDIELTQIGSYLEEIGRFGKTSTAVNFNDDNYLEFVNTENPTKYSISTWIRKNSADENEQAHIINNNGSGQYTGDFQIVLLVRSGITKLNIVWHSEAGISQQYIFDSLYEIGKWFHLVVNFDSDNKIVDVYVNNKFISSSLSVSTTSDLTTVKPLPSATYYIGSHPSVSISSTVFTDMSMADFKLYKRLLGKSEIKQQYKEYKSYLVEYLDIDIDFDTGEINDSISGLDAGLRYSYSYPKTTNGVIVPAALINTNTDFTIRFSIFIFGSNMYGGGLLIDNDNTFGLTVWYDDRFNFKVHTNSLLNILWENYGFSILTTGYYTFTITRSANTYKLFRNNQFVVSIIGGNGSSTEYYLNKIENGTEDRYLKSFTYLPSALSDAQVENFNLDDYRQEAINQNGVFFTATNLPPIDIISGTQLTYSGSYIKDNFGYGNLRYGFELYTEDAGTNKLYVPIKPDNTSFNKVIAGYTSQGIYTQSGSELLPCESGIILPDNSILKAADADNFWFDASGVPLIKYFDDIYNEAPAYTEVSYQDSKITKIKIKQ